MYTDQAESVAGPLELAERREGWNRSLIPLILFALVILLGATAAFRPRPAPEVKDPGDRSSEVPRGLDLNRAAWFELAQLPGVGESLARRIVEYRQNAGRPLRVRDLIAVKGIGPRTLDRIAAYLRHGPD